MPTTKPRVQVTLEPETHAVIERLAALQGRTRGSVIAEMLDAVVPTIERSVALLEAALSAPELIKDGLRAVVQGAQEDLAEAAGDTSKQLDILMRSLDSDAPPTDEQYRAAIKGLVAEKRGRNS